MQLIWGSLFKEIPKLKGKHIIFNRMLPGWIERLASPQDMYPQWSLASVNVTLFGKKELRTERKEENPEVGRRRQCQNRGRDAWREGVAPNHWKLERGGTWILPTSWREYSLPTPWFCSSGCFKLPCLWRFVKAPTGNYTATIFK